MISETHRTVVRMTHRTNDSKPVMHWDYWGKAKRSYFGEKAMLPLIWFFLFLTVAGVKHDLTQKCLNERNFSRTQGRLRCSFENTFGWKPKKFKRVGIMRDPPVSSLYFIGEVFFLSFSTQAGNNARGWFPRKEQGDNRLKTVHLFISAKDERPEQPDEKHRITFCLADVFFILFMLVSHHPQN